ncbi:hypothetical protein GWC95_00410 [Sediminibacterium roseum]|uniref:Uncharacterized protein n=1 Tax=Sediminibacterium roseum TaxID=1978412 RepID=A0ABW9ZMR8_9BACT|nr:hypothetical protein [Sediminibacterium roseum]NCI48361.1 hypothetical protein [Sediminibacterium roseum]
MKQLLPAILLLLSVSCFSQSDLLVLKQKNQIIQTWVPGSVFHFQFSSKQWIQGIIKQIKNDSVLVDQISVIQVPNAFGFPRIDTAHMGLLQFHVSEIYGMPKRDYAGIFTNGALFQLGSAAYILLNLANTAIHKEQLFSAVNATRLGVAGGIFVIGSLLSATHKTYIRLGKKYTVTTIHTR